MKKILLCFILIFGMFAFPIDAKAISASSSLSGPTTVTVGSTISVTASVSASRMYIIQGNITSSNNSVLSGSGSLYKKADLSVSENGFTSASKTVQFTAKSEGTATIKLIDTGIGITVDDEPISFSSSLTVKVVAKTNNTSSNSSSSSSSSSSNNSSSSTTTTVQEPEVKKSSEKNLSSLSVSEGTLSPKFSAGTTTYKVDLTNEVKKLTISAKAKDSKASVSGTGEKELKIGENNFTVTVTAEDGSKKTYTISVYVTEKPTQFVKLGDQNLGILNDLSKADVPKGFEKTTIKIDDKDVTALQNKDLGLTLLYLQTEDEKTGFYIYDVDNNKVLRQYQTLTVNGKTYVIMDAPENLEEVQGLEKSTIKIGDLEMNGWKFNEETLSHYTLVYLMNDAGESGLYTYEDTEGTLQKYTPVEEKDNTLTYVFIGTTVVFALSTAVVGYMYFNFKKKSISAIKDYYDKKNQG
ncbi:cadherin-like beta sandwich domain-containing protein [Massilimicrobiota sp. An134]|uniref:cadherin-like beta sandwich domain-containing protein n=1 Tax=Massilimicrobiota sp. An134 TaxID=1965557 RepID=UPI001F150719|nr:cadherin-like beta sandwich domain-containing protein [Massilimicrobiota sp. An134]